MISTVFQSSVLAHLQGHHGVTSAKAFSYPIMMVEFADCQRIGGEQILATGQAPLQYLKGHHRNPIGYFLPACTPTRHQLADPTDGVQADPYWMRRSWRKMCEQNDWYMKDAQGKILVWSSYRQPVVDLWKKDACDWVVNTLITSDLDWYMLDTMFLRFMAYIPGMTDTQQSRMIQGYTYIGQRLREHGRKVLGNGAWEMYTPDGEWMMPYVKDGAIDMVMVEWPAGFRHDGRWWAVDDHRFARITEYCAQHHVSTLLYAKYVSQPGHYNSSKFGSREEHDKHYGNLAHDHQAIIALGENTNRTWYEPYMDAWAGPSPDPQPAPLPPEHTSLEDRVDRLEQDIEQIRTCFCGP